MANLGVSRLFVIFSVAQATLISRGYIAKLELDDKKSNNKLLGEYNSQSLIECAAMCVKECGFFGYHGELKKCRVHKKIFTFGLSDEAGWRYYLHDYFPFDCKDLHEDSHTNSGVYEIYPDGTSSRSLSVYCDMETMDGGWTAIQKRVNGSLSFDRDWTGYKNGFGSPVQDGWIGNEVIHHLTKGKNSALYVSVTLVNGSRLYELYEQFSVSDEAANYQLFLAGNVTGTLGSSKLMWNGPIGICLVCSILSDHHGDSMLNSGSSYRDLSGMYFTTPDRDNDRNINWQGGNCAAAPGFRGGWWFKDCAYAFLNGVWPLVHWFPTFPLEGTSVRETMMMMRINEGRKREATDQKRKKSNYILMEK
ncbi:angiopoietin-2-like [Saccostrea echinata]|uniref:angiopoietin-2-like n=1 Tax=Saccostrea echinata TaxID=191078 RepID=UPI002A840899|nr:angiopoietin-2-like [Saccostrea echinata]